MSSYKTDFVGLFFATENFLVILELGGSVQKQSGTSFFSLQI